MNTKQLKELKVNLCTYIDDHKPEGTPKELFDAIEIIEDSIVELEIDNSDEDVDDLLNELDEEFLDEQEYEEFL